VGDTPVGMGESVTPLGVGLMPPLPLPIAGVCVGVRAGEPVLGTLPVPLLSEEDPLRDTRGEREELR
jgi:hypothetical protein